MAIQPTQQAYVIETANRLGKSIDALTPMDTGIPPAELGAIRASLLATARNHSTLDQQITDAVIVRGASSTCADEIPKEAAIQLLETFFSEPGFNEYTFKVTNPRNPFSGLFPLRNAQDIIERLAGEETLEFLPIKNQRTYDFAPGYDDYKVLTPIPAEARKFNNVADFYAWARGIAHRPT